MIRDEDIRDDGLLETYVAKYYERDKHHPLNNPFDAMGEDFKGFRPKRERKQTDKKCCCLFSFYLL